MVWKPSIVVHGTQDSINGFYSAVAEGRGGQPCDNESSIKELLTVL